MEHLLIPPNPRSDTPTQIEVWFYPKWGGEGQRWIAAQRITHPPHTSPYAYTIYQTSPGFRFSEALLPRAAASHALPRSTNRQIIVPGYQTALEISRKMQNLLEGLEPT